MPQIKNVVSSLARFAWALAQNPRLAKLTAPVNRGIGYSSSFSSTARNGAAAVEAPMNPLEEYFHANEKGPGIFKWLHYFDVYHRHFSKFIGKKINVMEVGVYSGGSLNMWRKYFGPECNVYGVDIEPACRAYATEGIEIIIGDQGNRNFWRQVKEKVGQVDVFIDDGSHFPEHQIVTLEEMLPNLAPGGVFLCEDIPQHEDGMVPYLFGLASAFYSGKESDFLSAVDSIHLYPGIGVIEKMARPGEHRSPMSTMRRGTEWAPFDSYAPKGKGWE